MGPSDLEAVIGELRNSGNGSILVGPGDDAGVYLLNGIAIVETVDVITPVVNDPFTFGAISANNSISDVYAMGGSPVSALAVAGFPSCDYEPSVLMDILRGARESLKKAGAFLIGGHSFDNNELKFGLSVTGVADKKSILRVSGARKNDCLVLTKPLGTGILSTALKGGKLNDNEMQQAIDWMLTLNDKASAIAKKAQASACTDVTGFGLLGHAYNMVRGSKIDFHINSREVPVMERIFDMVDSGMVPEGTYNNLRFFEDNVDFAHDIDEAVKLVLSDPQTSGGLLISVAEKDLVFFENSSLFYKIIGRVVKGSGKLIVK